MLGLATVLYVLMAMFIVTMTEPKHPAKFWLINIGQLVLITAPLVWFSGRLVWWVLLIYAVTVYTVWLLQFFSICTYNIVPGKVYDCEYYGFGIVSYDGKDKTLHLGLIGEGPFLTGVIIEDYEPNADDEIVKVIFDEEASKKNGGEVFRVFDERTRSYREEMFTAYVKKANV